MDDRVDTTVSLVPAIEQYDLAWNADAATRRELLDAALTDDCELLEPRKRFVGRAAIAERLDGFAERFPGAQVDVTTAVDEHHAVARYGWRIVAADGSEVLEGVDVVDGAPDGDGRLRRIVMFFGPLDPARP